MKVYIVETGEDHEASSILAVCAALETARQVAALHMAGKQWISSYPDTWHDLGCFWLRISTWYVQS